MPNSTHEFFEILGKILLRCWIFGFVLLFIWAAAFLTGAVHKLHGPLMGLSAHDLNVIHYCGMAFLKLSVILFFFFPWLAIRLVLSKARG
ncbi:MAG: DUF6868 family protein [Thermoguttaceae bacterium]|jgi:hypothetical protein